MIRVLVLAAYASVRAGIRSMVETADDVEVIAELPPAVDLEPVVTDLRPDVVVYDVNEPAWREVLRSATSSGAAVVVLSEGSFSFALTDTMATGLAWLNKDADREDLVAAIQAADAGLVAVDRATAAAEASRTSEPGQAHSEISPRELEVLQLMAAGLPNKQIAMRLGISMSTAKFHVASILAKLDASSRTEAVTEGVRRGLVRV